MDEPKQTKNEKQRSAGPAPFPDKSLVSPPDTSAARRVGDRRWRKTPMPVVDSLANDAAMMWHYAKSGYDWSVVFGQDEQGNVADFEIITPIEVPRGGYDTVDYRQYAPEPGLFIKLSELQPDKHAVLDFANKFGLLGVSQIMSPPDDDPSKIYSIFGETMEVWERVIRNLKGAVRLWQLIQEDQIAEISKLLKWGGGIGWLFEDPGWGTFCEPGLLGTIGDGFRRLPLPTIPKDKPIEAASRFVQLLINYHLPEHCKFLLLWSESRNNFVTKLVPTDLVGFAWLQFSRTVTKEVQFTACKVCRGPIEIGQDRRQRNAVFCSAKCKMKAQRAREREANELADSGLSAAAIAEKMRIKPATILSWLAKREHRQ
jgi:hypothetical protein